MSPGATQAPAAARMRNFSASEKGTTFGAENNLVFGASGFDGKCVEAVLRGC